MVASEILNEIWEVIEDRASHPTENSYTSKILTHRKGKDKALEKVGEESTEFIIAIKNGEKSRISEEAADLIFHLMIALKSADVQIQSVWDELQSRRQ